MPEENWSLIIGSRSKWYQMDLKSIWKYRDLIMLMVRRDFVSVYKQTILGPLWFFIQPVFSTLIFTVIFGNIAKISTDGIPSILFYLGGLTLWNYFSDCLNKTSNTFVQNAGIFGKVYFPRLVVPLSVLISNLYKLGVQFLLFLSVWFYFILIKRNVSPNWSYFYLFPILIILMAGLGLGFGLVISSLTTKYRDLTFLLGFGVQLMMYASPIVYPVSMVPEQYRIYILANPVSPVIETFKFIFLGNGYFSWTALGYSFCFMAILLVSGMLVFHKVEKSFMDTV
ncbi:MAG: ABC transporter permease [Bacteroidia bacterium]|nr:ABC transporter permease [Bacteroidia bacterium]